MTFIAHIRSRSGSPFYVSDLPGCDGDRPNRANPNSDWGYTSDFRNALILTESQWERFEKASLFCGQKPYRTAV